MNTGPKMLPVDIIGKKYGRLTIICQVENTISGFRAVMAKCDCGKIIETAFLRIKKGRTRSCGCLRKETMFVHGLRRHKLYHVWYGIKRRCYSVNEPNYKKYGAKGVIICNEWKNNFKAFYDWCIDNGWKDGMQIDKDAKALKLGISPPLIYSPEWCSILTPAENNSYKVTNRIVEFNGEKKTLTEWARQYNLNRRTVSTRMDDYGWSFEKAITTKVKVIA